MAILEINPAGDLALSRGSFVYLSGPDFVRQKIASRFQFFRGEWFLDQRLGIPYFTQVFLKRPNIEAIRSMFRRVVAETPGVGSVTRFSLAYDDVARTAAFDFEAVLVNGAGSVVVTTAHTDFIVSLNP